ncbi:nucleoporin subcomplex protein binding to Pom34-domain-containing protein [Lophiotrema nucula]|uniref:Nucleoporin subcomplex protein binding to Pom34-domain-containing protein n=1 Tax=Lophiotrema nucula TaxID=690887 RepID=A0A6A5ZT13_9PLEO|nr:nucleoporin subcomplex protein binding to Pom34-domain-containing protein [Lophiotrema nucula]
MAPISAPDPPALDLAKCFRGEQQPISWETAYTALCDPETASKSARLRDFLTAETNVKILSKPWSPFADPSPQEKSKFETATAPIHVPASTSGQYSIDEIKEDSLWLSQQARISEYAALRLAVMEWLERPTRQLLGGLTEEEALSVQEAAGVTNLGASTFIPNSSIITAPSGLSSASDTLFDSPDQRKLRLLTLYLATRVSILRISQLLVTWGAAGGLRRSYGDDYRVCGDWLEQLGLVISSKQRDASSPASTFLDQCIRTIQSRLDIIGHGFEWTVPDAIQEVAEERWITLQLTEVVHLLHITLVHSELLTTGFVAAATVEEWFTVMLTRRYFVDTVFPSPTAQALVPIMHVLAALVSLSILKTDKILRDIEDGQYRNWDRSTYVLNTALVENITTNFGYTKQLGPSPATPPAFAWAVITWKLTEEAARLEVDRERQIESGRRDSAAPRDPLEEAALAIPALDSGDMTERIPAFQDLAITCSDFQVFDIVKQTADLVVSVYGTAVDRISRDRCRLLLLHLVRAALQVGIVSYGPELILSIHAIISGDRSFRRWIEHDAPRYADPVAAFFLNDDHVLRPELLQAARDRYPYETTPLLKFSSALTRGEKVTSDEIPTIAGLLDQSTTLMQRMPYHFKGYIPTREEENNNDIRLLEPLPQFDSPQSGGFRRRLLSTPSADSRDESMVIPMDTEGRIVDDSAEPMVAMWKYKHSALKYLIRLLSTYTVESREVELGSQEAVATGTATEIIRLITDLIHASIRASPRSDAVPACSTELLTVLRIGTDRNEETVTIILAIFEQELLRLCQEPGNEESLELLVNCVHFLRGLVTIAPNRVWPWLAKSRLLETDGNGGSLATILIGTELVLGRYDFLIGCIQLFGALVNDAVGRAVSRKTPSKALTRFNAATTPDSGTSDKIISSTLLTFGRTLTSVYEGFSSWKYNQIEDRLEISIGICNAFRDVLEFAYGVDDAPKLSSKVTGLVAPLAEYITVLYLTKADNDLPTNPLLTSLISGVDSTNSSILTSSTALWKQRTKSTLAFASILVRVAILLNRPWTHLEHQLFKATPLLARLYATNNAHKSSVLQLLESLVRGAMRIAQESDSMGKRTREKREPPSLLGHLGPRTAKNFLSILSQLDEPLRLVDIQDNVWSLLSAVVTCKQRWFSLYLLTGSTPRETVRSKPVGDSGPTRSKALLTRALDALSQLKLEKPNRPWSLYTAMLEFVASAQNNWTWAMGDLRQHKPFVHQLLEFLKWLAKEPKDLRSEAGYEACCHQNKFATLACEVLAMYVHGARQAGDVTALKDIVPSLTYFENNALELPDYNVSLHSNLKQNFEREFRGVTLANFKRTTLYPEHFGRSFFYDTQLANRLLGFDSKWSGPKGGQGFYGEVIRANLNLSYVESQVQLLSSWKLLAIELSNSVDKDERLAKVLINVVQDCMFANAQSLLPEALFGQLMTVRADLAFALLQQMVRAKIKLPEARRLLSPIWTAIAKYVTSGADFDTIFSSSGADYYRSLLRILYLALQFHVLSPTASKEDVDFRSSLRASVPAKPSELAEPISSQLLGILTDAVAKGFRSLATQLHAEPDSVSPSDFALLTAILQTILSIPEMTSWESQAALIFAHHNTVRYASSLFSWSDRLTINDKDPVYGELSLLFILSLSNIRALAETMAVEGILSSLNTANLMNYFRRPGGMSPFDSPPRVFNIWSKGILPLCLNLLSAVGPAIAAEIGAFLNSLPEQLSRASNSLNSRNSNLKISLSVASETHSLALISAILEANRAQGPRLGIQASDIPTLEWDKENVKEDIEGWVARKGALREKIVVMDEGEAGLYAKEGNGGEGNALEVRVLGELDGALGCLGVGKGGA